MRCRCEVWAGRASEAFYSMLTKINCPRGDNQLLMGLDLDPNLSATSMLALWLISARRSQRLWVSTEVDRTQTEVIYRPDVSVTTGPALNGPSAGNVCDGMTWLWRGRGVLRHSTDHLKINSTNSAYYHPGSTTQCLFKCSEKQGG